MESPRSGSNPEKGTGVCAGEPFRHKPLRRIASERNCRDGPPESVAVRKLAETSNRKRKPRKTKVQTSGITKETTERKNV